MRTVRTVAWVLVGIAAFALVWLLLWADYRAAQVEDGSLGFQAVFELTDHQGMIRTQEDFAGRWMLVFFGFANCPDVCPTTLAEIAAVMDGLGEDAPMVQPLFISVDPERDTPAAMADFMQAFDAGIVGLTGTPEQTDRTGDSFHIYFEKVEQAAAPGGYTMSHSSQLFLFGPDGAYVKSWTYGTPAEDILADLKQKMSS
ncbi:SCO family protein [Jannaschia rubra]|uniref:BsSco n=1 Tax=Jannaschia rubra TaxID=282197 RepID=A0A0M6XW82_9RHOB|nr:SCO family protein [Jannaschia rubra]CTQ34541.1 BsSco [Jannaschia rubra]